MEEFIIDEKYLEILNKYGWIDGSLNSNFDLLSSKFVNKYNKEINLEFNFFLTDLRIKTAFNYCLGMRNEKTYQIHIYLYNKNGLYFIHGDSVYHHLEDFTKDREQDFNNIKFITKIGSNLENDIKKYNLMSDGLFRDSKLEELLD